ncbi:MAG TPA: protein kinase [Vicinamibacteria bacterium]|nr:protein kinase [Vicinamibacteria bacterium]
MSPEPEVVDGKYRLLRVIGEGASGRVFEAVHVALGKRFAVKLLRTAEELAPETRRRFEVEASALGRLHHPNVVAVTDFGPAEGRSGPAYLVTELIEGESLDSRLRTRGALPLREALPILEGIAAALDHAHSAGVLHRDLKPANVLLRMEAPAGEVAKVLDFGTATMVDRVGPKPPAEPSAGAPLIAPHAMRDARLTESGALLGTPCYVAPELITAPQASRASDIYSFGVMAYEMLAGHPPFAGSVAEVLAGHLREAPPRPSPAGPALPEDAVRALLSALDKDPSGRPPSAGALVAALRAAERRSATEAEARKRLPKRVLASVLIPLAAFVVARWLAASQIGQFVERRVQAAALALLPSRSPDPRILLLTMDEASLRADPRPLSDRADEISRTLDGMLRAGASGVALDFLLPRRWAESEAFSRLLLEHPDAVTLAAMAQPDGQLLGTECLSELTAVALGPERAAALFGLVNLDQEPDGAVWRGRIFFENASGGRHASWAARAVGGMPATASERPRFLLDHTLDRTRFDSLPWWRANAALRESPQSFRDRLILIGGDLVGVGDDAHLIPRGRRAETVSGLTVQALAVDTLLRGSWIHEVPLWPFDLLAVLVAAATAWELSASKSRVGLSLALAVGLGLALAAVVVPRWARALVPVVAPTLTLALAALGSLMTRSGRTSWDSDEGGR